MMSFFLSLLFSSFSYLLSIFFILSSFMQSPLLFILTFSCLFLFLHLSILILSSFSLFLILFLSLSLLSLHTLILFPFLEDLLIIFIPFSLFFKLICLHFWCYDETWQLLCFRKWVRQALCSPWMGALLGNPLLLVDALSLASRLTAFSDGQVSTWEFSPCPSEWFGCQLIFGVAN